MLRKPRYLVCGMGLKSGICCVQLLQFEVSYSRADHEAWLRGPGREEMTAARKELGVNGFKDDNDFEEEVAMQINLFNRCVCMPVPHNHAAAATAVWFHI